jgi:thiamine-monophosphate kinase
MSITAIGIENDENIVKRSTAKPNDLLVVTGDLGGAYMGLQILEREHAVFLLIRICSRKWKATIIFWKDS